VRRRGANTPSDRAWSGCSPAGAPARSARRGLPPGRSLFHSVCADAEAPELHGLARTISSWYDQLLAYFHTSHASNGRTETVKLLIKRTKRVGFGIRNFNNYRTRLLLHCRLLDSPRNTDEGTLTSPGVVEPSIYGV